MSYDTLTEKERTKNEEWKKKVLAWLEKQKEKRDFRKLYKDIAKSEWFKKSYEGKSLGCDDEQKEQNHPDGCFTCDEYKKGYEAGRLNGITAGYNKAMKEVNEQKEQNTKHTDYIKEIREELLGIENNAKDIDGLTESQWVAIRAAHRLLGKYVEQEQKPVSISCGHENDKSAEWKQENISELSDFECAMLHIGESFFSRNAGLDPNNTTCVKEQARLLLESVYTAEWSEKDKLTIAELINYFEGDPLECSIEEMVQRIKSLRPSWKPSEQEKGALKTAISILTEERSFPKAAAHLQAILDAFDGKEARKEWKPSEEQLEALESCGQCNKQIYSLYLDLKKL